MDAVKTALAVVGAYTVVGFVNAAWLYFRDRSGNSGRSEHWTKNPRIGASDE